MSESPFEDRNSPLTKNRDSGPRPLSESSIERGDGYVIFSPEDPEVGGIRIILKWGGNPPEKNKQPDQKGGGGKGKDKGEKEDGEFEGDSGKGGEKEGEEKDGERAKSQGGEKGDKGKNKDGEAGGESELGDLDKILDKISGQDILGGGRNRGEPDEDDKILDKISGQDILVEISSDITDVPPPSEEEDLSFLDVIFDKD
jgi:hypothetical protein